jgi:carboxypeptidase Taq
MPEPESNSPSFDFLSEGEAPQPEESAAANGDAIFDFADEGSAEQPGAAAPADPIGPPAEALIPEAGAAAAAAEPGFFDEMFGEAGTAETSRPAEAPAAATEPAAESPEAGIFDFGDEPQAATPAPATIGPPSPEAPEPTLDYRAGIEEPAEIPIAGDVFPPAGDDLLGAAAMAGAALVAGGAAATGGEVAPPPTEEEPPLPEDPEINDPQPTAAPLADDHPQMQTYAKLCGHVRQASTLGAIEAAISWDERCMMPAAAAEQRAEQITMLSGIIHERLVDPRIGEWLAELADGELTRDPHDDYGATIRQIRRQYEKRTKLPKELVEELAHTAVMGQHVWQEARKNDDYKSFAPLLAKMVELKQRQADALGYPETRYDALLDEFEPGELTSRVSAVLGALRDELVPLVAQVREGGRTPDLSILERRYPIEMQRTFGRAAAAKIGFDFERGRLDVTAHPFCTGLGPNDCRITTRYDEHFFNAGFFGILHEAGHGIYDQGLRSDQYGLPVGEAVSMGIHESQSRLWEIFVGRSLPFWRYLYGDARAAFPEALNDVTLGKFFFAVNDVRPSLIRVEADEFTYNLHILIRFELEQALIGGDLQADDLPGAWREKYRQYLGIEPPNDADGVLQDIHWSAGLFGYFPTYSLGNLYAAQFYEQADRELGGLERRFAQGEFNLLRRWLRAKIHLQGQKYPAAELCERITGGPLSHAPLMRHLRAKYDLLYAPDAASLDELDVARPAGGTQAAMLDVAGYGVAADEGDTAVFGMSPLGSASAEGFAGMGLGGGVAAPAWKKKKSGGLLTMLVLLLGIVGGGVIGTSLGYWILLWWKGPSADFLKIRDKLPGWMVPSYTPPEDLETVPAVPPPGATSTEPAAARPIPRDVSRALTMNVLAAARARCS